MSEQSWRDVNDKALAELEVNLDTLCDWVPSAAPGEPNGLSIVEAIDTAKAIRDVLNRLGVLGPGGAASTWATGTRVEVSGCVPRTLQEHKLGAIKLVRELTGLELRDAKERVDSAATTPFDIGMTMRAYEAQSLIDRLSAVGLTARMCSYG